MQSNLEKIGIDLRKEKNIQNTFYKSDENEYSVNHDKALTHNDELHPHGKGTKDWGEPYRIPNKNAPKTIDKKVLPTNDGGGSYDIFGKNGIGGRNFLQSLNIYSNNNEYGENSINEEENIKDGQYYI